MDSIFSDENKVSGQWIRFHEVGDKVSGTLVDVREVPDNYKPGQMQKIYELKQEDGNIALVGGKPGIDFQMKGVNLGQIVGMEFVKTKPPKNPAHKPAKIIQIFFNKDIVDEEWLELHNATKDFGGKPVSGASAPAAPQKPLRPVKPAAQAEDGLSRIMDLAVEKLGATDEEDAKVKIMEATKLAFLDVNYPQILEKLENL